MERIEDLVHPNAAKTQARNVESHGRLYAEVWLPALPLPMYGVRYALADAWAVLWGRATAVQWPHQRQVAPPSPAGTR